MPDYDMVEATIIMMAGLALALVMVVGCGAVMDEIDYRLYATDAGSHPSWSSVGHMLHDWYFGLIGIYTLIILVWYVKVAVRKLGYNRSQGW